MIPSARSPSLSPRARRHSFVLLWALSATFAGRIIVQLVQRISPVATLPPFEAWQSGLLPYGLLISLQLSLLAGMIATNIHLGFRKPVTCPLLAGTLLSLGACYFAFMLFRWGAALTFGAGHHFWGASLPAFFHLILAGWLILVGQQFENTSDRISAITPIRWLVYPALIAICLWLHYALSAAGVGVQLSAYSAVLLGAIAITVFERWLPYRGEWQPDSHEIANDLTFMVFVQILLPKVLAFLTAVTVLRWLQDHDLVLTAWWPHGLPAPAQALVMLLTADFFRYWLHRASHEWSPWLWRFHAVHHSPPKLNWVNVGRFHPLEKSLQFLCDAAPFLLVGVSENVLALYFVFYAVNGFYQHSNVDARLGLLNFIVSGPELHRWHHAREIRESNKNYGNNLILWDLLFGSFFLPHDRKVGELGLINRNYPRSFLHQMRSPFIRGLDQADK